MSAEDDIALIRASRSGVTETISLVNAALRPLVDAPGADTDAVIGAVKQLWFVDDDLAWCEEQLQRRSDGGE